LSQAGAQKSSGTTGTLHQATLTGLLPSTQYEYRVRGDGGTWSDVYLTKTAPPPGNANFDFVYIADTGLVNRPDGLSTGTQQIIDDIAAMNPLLVLGGGDYAYYKTDKRFGPLDAHIDAWFNQSAPFLTQSAYMPTLGNHEVRLQESYDSWIQRMALPASQTENFNVYSFDVGQIHFVSILAVLGNVGIPASQLDWIIQDVEAARARGQTWIIPYMHVSAFADGSAHPSNIGLRNQLGPVFEQLGVHLVISSHDQNYERTYPLINVGQGSPVVTDQNLTGYDENDGIVWLKVSPAGKLSNEGSGFSTFQTNPPPYWTAARDDTLHHFARFLVSADGTLTTQIYATPGNGTPSFVYDSFTYSLDAASGGGSQSSAVAVQFAVSDPMQSAALDDIFANSTEHSVRPTATSSDVTLWGSYSSAMSDVRSSKSTVAAFSSSNVSDIHERAIQQLKLLNGRLLQVAFTNSSETPVKRRNRESAEGNVSGPGSVPWELALEEVVRYLKVDISSVL
jgi:hypothetical protein